MNSYYVIEVEATNYCGAGCVFCANSRLERARGFMDVNQFAAFLQRQRESMRGNFFARRSFTGLPRVTFCGLGDPLLHPEISELVRLANEQGLYTQLVTLGLSLTPQKAEALYESGLDELALSLHSLDDTNYHQITGLPLEKVKNQIKACAPVIHRSGKKLSIWRVYHPDPRYRDGDDGERYAAFLKECGLSADEILGPSEPWYRDGVVPDSRCLAVHDDPFWCNKIPFTFNIDWMGNVILCCNDYNRETVRLGNAFSPEFDEEAMWRIKRDIFERKNIPEICRTCRRWPDDEIWGILEKNHVSVRELTDFL